MSKEINVGADGIMTMKGGKGFVATGQAATSLDLAQAYNMNLDDLRQITQVILTNENGGTSVYQVCLWSARNRHAGRFFSCKI